MILNLHDLPEPPSANRYWRHAKGRTYLHKDARAYRLVVRMAYIQRTKSLKIAFPDEPLSVTFTWLRARKSGDLDNRIKQLLDALCGLAYTDDDQIVHIDATRYDGKRKGRIDITIEPALIRYAG